MGVTYSSNIESSIDEKLLKYKERLRMSFDVVQRLVLTYNDHALQPIQDENGIRSLFSTSLRSYVREDPIRSSFIDDLLEAVWIIFSDSATCYPQEVIVILILLSDAPWNKRLSLIFDLFKAMNLEELYHEEIQLASQVTAQALLRLWRSSSWPFESLRGLSEGLADHALLKLDKDITEAVSREEFVRWGSDRFREGRTVATSEALMKIFETTYT